MTDLPAFENSFVTDVEAMVRSGAGYVEAILHWCHLKGVEQEQIIPLIKSNPTFRNKLTEEATTLHFLKKRKTRKRGK